MWQINSKHSFESLVVVAASKAWTKSKDMVLALKTLYTYWKQDFNKKKMKKTKKIVYSEKV